MYITDLESQYMYTEPQKSVAEHFQNILEQHSH